MVAVPGGEWRSVLPTGTREPLVRVAPFRLDRVPVTNADFLTFVRANPQWQRGQVPAALADEGYLRHWQSAQALGSAANPSLA
jgi:formylglycine-generating enzyme required for sulfatase activity